MDVYVAAFVAIYHIYKEVWSASIDVLWCKARNREDLMWWPHTSHENVYARKYDK